MLDKTSYFESTKASYLKHTANITGSAEERARKKFELHQRYRMELAKFDEFERWATISHKEFMNDAFGIFCVCGRWDKPLMWTHYASEHASYCVGFDKKHRFFNEKGRTVSPLTKVHYSDDLHVLSMTDRSSFNSGIIFKKSQEWEYEDEHRMLGLFSGMDKPCGESDRLDRKFPVYTYELPYEAVRELILGVRCRPDIEAAVKAFAHRIGAPCYRASFEQQSHRMNRVLC